MPKNSKSKIKVRSEKKVIKNSIWNIFDFGESYTSLILGIIVVVIATVLILILAKGRNTPAKQEFAKEIKIEKTIPIITKEQIKMDEKIASGSSYVVVQGDTLWKIAEKKYNNGYNWVDIQKANKLTNPDIILIGTKLTLPKIVQKITTELKVNNTNKKVTSSIQKNKILGTSYTVVKGDTLWDIAVRAYGDGYAWTKIASANKLLNPNIIHSGNKFIIPRD